LRSLRSLRSNYDFLTAKIARITKKKSRITGAFSADTLGWFYADGIIDPSHQLPAMHNPASSSRPSHFREARELSVSKSRGVLLPAPARSGRSPSWWLYPAVPSVKSV
jgi:hypothetical protein